MTEQLTADETAAMQAMQADTAPVEDVPAEQAAPAEAAPVAEAQPAEPEPAKPPPGMVPQQALHQERERRKETERLLAEMQAQIAKLTAPPPQEIVVPDPVLEPEKFKQFQIDQIKQRAQERQQLEAQQEAQRQDAAFQQRLTQDAAQFRAQTPDYPQAFEFAVKGRREELAFYGYSAEQIEAQIEVDVRALAQQAYAQGKNPAQSFYDYAKMRGYSAAPPQPAPQPQAAAQVQAFAEAQRQTQSLAPAGGPSNDGGITLESVAKMSEAQLAKMPKAERDEMMRKVMGG